MLPEFIAPVARVGSAAGEHGVNNFVYKLFAGDVNYFKVGLFGNNFVGYRLHKVGFAQTRTAVNEQRVVCARGVLGNVARRGVNKLVVFTDDEGIEGIFFVEVGGRRIVFLGGGVIGVLAAAFYHEAEVRNANVRLDYCLAHFFGEGAGDVLCKIFVGGFKHDIAPVHVDGFKLFYIRDVGDVAYRLPHLFLYGVVNKIEVRAFGHNYNKFPLCFVFFVLKY